MAFTPPPTPPNSGDPANFNTRADAFLGWFPGFVAELNAQAYPDLPALFRIDGTAAAPALSWGVDPDTGIFRAGENQLGFAAGGARRAMLSQSAYQIDVPVTGAAAQANATDASAGRLLKVGAFGLGSTSAPELADLDAFTPPAGLYLSGANTIGTKPPGASPADAVLVLRPAGNQATQIYSLPNDGATYVRKSMANTSWGPWRRLDTARGVNGNGEYVQFGDGTQICWHTLATSSSAEVTWVYPAAFLNTAPIRVALGVISAGMTSVAPRYTNKSSTQLDLSAISSANARIAANIDLMAIGRWF